MLRGLLDSGVAPASERVLPPPNAAAAVGEVDTCNMWLLHDVTETVVSGELSLSEMIM